MNDGSDESHSVEGYHNSWKRDRRSAVVAGASVRITAAMVPPAESPATAIRVGVGADLRAVLGDP